MSKSDEIPLRVLIKEHMDESRKSNIVIMDKLARIETHNEYTKLDIARLNKDVDNLNTHKNKQIGFLAAASIIVGVVIEYVKSKFE
jgi:hypothetical protein